MLDNENQLSIKEFDKMEKDANFIYELINGQVYVQTSPSKEHQEFGARLVGDLVTCLNKAETKCKVAYELYVEDVSSNTKVRPDIQVKCSKENIPSVAIEILSSNTRGLDLFIKLNKYPIIGVKEYWVVDLGSKDITVHGFNTTDGILSVNTTCYKMGDVLVSPCIGISLDIRTLFER